ncbi:hypothetical protein NUW58_g3350 [Xylaria curta]|uniref:Uncharacterized protein n=1 Tax=Xylaria curta TaxID=42375 RepID=A0ACC1PBD9_9PEZI|nr:hypothetical protein NUW58_g3350 [Xylaria curta]
MGRSALVSLHLGKPNRPVSNRDRVRVWRGVAVSGTESKLRRGQWPGSGPGEQNASIDLPGLFGASCWLGSLSYTSYVTRRLNFAVDIDNTKNKGVEHTMLTVALHGQLRWDPSDPVGPQWPNERTKTNRGFYGRYERPRYPWDTDEMSFGWLGVDRAIDFKR